MSKFIREPRPPAEEEPVTVCLQPDDLAALDAFSAYFTEPTTRPQAIRFILVDWLRTHGLFKADHPEPTGPATEVIKRMDAEIEAHRREKTGRRKDPE